MAQLRKAGVFVAWLAVAPGPRGSCSRIVSASLIHAWEYHANELPWHHRDPADRFIIATARILNLTVVTAGTRFADYDVKVIR